RRKRIGALVGCLLKRPPEHIITRVRFYKPMDNTESFPGKGIERPARGAPLGPKGGLILGVMPEFNRDSLSFITRCREYGDVVRTRFFYVTAYFLYHPDDIENVLSTNAKNFVKSMSLRSNFFQRLVGNG